MMVAVLMKDISETGFVLNKITFDGQRIRFSSAIQMDGSPRPRGPTWTYTI